MVRPGTSAASSAARGDRDGPARCSTWTLNHHDDQADGVGEGGVSVVGVNPRPAAFFMSRRGVRQISRNRRVMRLGGQLVNERG